MRQIFILEKDEMTALRGGEPLTIMLGGQTIVLQADVVKRVQQHSNDNGAVTDRRTIAWKRANNKRQTISDRVVEFVKEQGPVTAIEIVNGVHASRSAVASSLARNKGVTVKRTGRGRRAVWRAKT